VLPSHIFETLVCGSLGWMIVQLDISFRGCYRIDIESQCTTSFSHVEYDMLYLALKRHRGLLSQPANGARNGIDGNDQTPVNPLTKLSLILTKSNNKTLFRYERDIRRPDRTAKHKIMSTPQPEFKDR